MQINIQDPQLIRAIQLQAAGLGMAEDNIAEGALADHFGFPDIALAATSVQLNDERQTYLPFPTLAPVPRTDSE